MLDPGLPHPNSYFIFASVMSSTFCFVITAKAKKKFASKAVALLPVLPLVETSPRRFNPTQVRWRRQSWHKTHSTELKPIHVFVVIARCRSSLFRPRVHEHDSLFVVRRVRRPRRGDLPDTFRNCGDWVSRLEQLRPRCLLTRAVLEQTVSSTA